MAKWLEEAEEAKQAIERCEPGVEVSIRKSFLRRHWAVRVVRSGQKPVEYEDINHYWLESTLIETFGGGRKRKREE